MRRIGYVVAVVIAQAAAVASAQSLGQAAQNEKKKRETPAAEGKAPADKAKDKNKKVYTGEDLDSYAASRPDDAGASAKPAGEAATVELEVPSTSEPRADGRSPMGIADTSEGRAVQERSWRSRAKAAQAAVAAAESELKSAESQRGALGPGPQQYQGQNEWARSANAADARLARARTALETAKKNLEKFEEEARRAGIPPGWIR